MTWIALVSAVFLLIANGFFVAIEFALVATQKSAFEEKAKEGNRRALSAIAAVTDLNRQVAGAQLGITMASLGLGYLAEPAVAKVLEDTVLSGIGEAARHTIGAAIALTIATFFHILIGEMVPKNVALANAPGVTMWLAPLHRMFVTIFSPLIWLLNGLSELILRPFGVDAVDEQSEAKTPAELASLIEESRGGGVLDDFEHSMLAGALNIGEQTAESVMVPWPEVASISRSAKVAEIEEAVLDTGHSRFPLLSEDGAGRVVGWCHSKDLLGLSAEAWDRPLPAQLVRPLMLFGADQPLEKLLVRMQRSRRHFAVIVGADGGRVGICTMEDILELVVGDINDETDRTDPADVATAELR